MSLNPLLAGLPPVHPGEIIADMFEQPDFKHTKTAVAAALGLNRRGFYDLLGGKTGVTANTALRLSKVLGSRPEFWMKLQANHDLRVARDAMAEELAGLPTLEGAAA